MSKNKEFLKNIHIADFEYLLPEKRIAKYPLGERDQSKLLVYRNGAMSHTVFSNLPAILTPGDVLVFNNTRVIPARLKFKKTTGANIEIFCLEPVEPSEYQVAFQSHRCTWKCIVGNLKKWKDGALTKEIDTGLRCIRLNAVKVADFKTHQYIEFTWDDDSLSFSEIIEIAGVTPIPPYLNRESEAIDYERYQTVYSKIKGSVAAPTAGLHFTKKLLRQLESNGMTSTEVTLHVGAGTFKPVQTDSIEEHEMHTEFFSVSADTLRLLMENHEKIVAVGTTTLRTLESLYWIGIKLNMGLFEIDNLLHLNQWDAYKLEATLSYSEAINILFEHVKSKGMTHLYATTQILIAPGYNIQSIKALITNFHQPKSTLLLLVATIVGSDWKKLYDYAMNHDFRFLSYGDSSILYLS